MHPGDVVRMVDLRSDSLIVKLEKIYYCHQMAVWSGIEMCTIQRMAHSG